MKTHIDEYLGDMEFSSRTKEDYRKDLSAFCGFSGGAEPTADLVRAYRQHLEDDGCGRSHVVRVLYALKGYCEWLRLGIFAKKGERSRDKIRVPALEFSAPPKTRTIEEVRRLLEAAITPLDRLLVLLPATTGARIGEIMGIDVKRDIDWENNCIALTRKGSRQRRQELSVSDRVMDAVREYIEWRGIKSGSLLPFSYQELRSFFQAVAKRAGVQFPRGSLFHNLRHFWFLYQKGKHPDMMDFISLYGGHSSRHTTDRIYGAFEPEEIRKRLEPLPWEMEEDNG